MSLYLPFDTYKVYADINGKQPLILSKAHLQELIPIQLFYRLVLEILEGVGKVSLIDFLQGGRKPGLEKIFLSSCLYIYFFFMFFKCL